MLFRTLEPEVTPPGTKDAEPGSHSQAPSSLVFDSVLIGPGGLAIFRQCRVALRPRILRNPRCVCMQKACPARLMKPEPGDARALLPADDLAPRSPRHAPVR